MSDPALYDDDILLWSEQQADVLRRIARTRRDLPNELDLENVAEEIESVGRSELAAVRSNIRLLLDHLIKLAVEPRSEAARHWLGEIVAFHSALADRYAPSMRQHIDMDRLWRSVREQATFALEEVHQEALAELPDRSPFVLDDFLADRIDSLSLIARLLPASDPEAR